MNTPLALFIASKGGKNIIKSAFQRYSYTCVKGDDYPVGTVVEIVIFMEDYTSKKGNQYKAGDVMVFPK